VFLVHPGGPYWENRDLGVWSIPKGEYDLEMPFEAAKREFTEETGVTLGFKTSYIVDLGQLRTSSNKIVTAWGVHSACSTDIKSNTFTMEWPPKSGILQEFPEVDRAGWFSLEEARIKISPGQVGFLDRLKEAIHG
jgi:predicted NUDIX family NTP pyrophosphohydrolase